MTIPVRIVVCLLLLVVSVDIVKGILPDVCSRPGHYHAIRYKDTTSSVAQGVRYQSGRPVLNYSGGKRSCEMGTWDGAGIALNIYDFAVQLASMLLGLPAMGCEMLFGGAGFCRIVRYLNALVVAGYLLVAIAHCAITGQLVLDLSMDEFDTVKKKLLRK